VGSFYFCSDFIHSFGGGLAVTMYSDSSVSRHVLGVFFVDRKFYHALSCTEQRQK
jgi:hypothetical protein